MAFEGNNLVGVDIGSSSIKVCQLKSADKGFKLLSAAVEPLPPQHPFWGMDNVLITPHLASITVPEDAARDVAESIRRVRSGAEPLYRIDPRRGY